MKTNTKSIMLSLALCMSAAGCVSTDVEPLRGGFEEVTYTHASLSEPAAHRVSLQYRTKEGKQVMIWPSLFGVRSVIKDDVAVFVGDQGYRQPPHNARATRPRLFAVKASGPPLDITDEVLWRWSKKSAGEFSAARKSSISYPKEKDNGVIFYFAGGPDVYLEWNQISDVIREVKEKGAAHKDSVWGTTYIEKEFAPEPKK